VAAEISDRKQNHPAPSVWSGLRVAGKRGQAFTCVDIGELPLGIEGERWPGPTPAAGEAAAREGQEARGLELQHSGAGRWRRSGAVSGGELRPVNLPSISLGLLVCLSYLASLQFGKKGERRVMRTREQDEPCAQLY